MSRRAATRTRRGLLAGFAAHPSDAEELASLLAAQQLSLACYDRVLGGRVLAPLPARSRALIGQMRGQESAHVRATRTALGRLHGRAPAAPSTLAAIDAVLERDQIGGRPGQLRGSHDAVGLLIAVERAAIGAAYAAVGGLRDGALAGLVARMMASDAQHEAVLHEQIDPGDVAGAIPYGIVVGLE